MSMFRRQLLGCLNSVWSFIESFNQSGPKVRPLPSVCKEEILRFVGLLPLARLDFRLQYHGVVTASDASSSGGGICASHQLSRQGVQATQGRLRGQLPELRGEHRVLTIGLFDGLGALRVAADLLGLSVLGHISVERGPRARRVVEAHFPEVLTVDDVAKVDKGMVDAWARQFSQAALVLVGGGPPCQGVSGLNAGRKGALRDERSSLFFHVRRIADLVKAGFPWAQTHSLMESVASMDEHDRDIMSSDYGAEPWFIDAGTLTWASRPRLYWVSWELTPQEGVSFLKPTEKRPRGVGLESTQPLSEVCKEGWQKVDPSRPFPTFTTSRPRSSPGYKPAGLNQCTVADARRWAEDQHRYPPYQYVENNLLTNRRGQLRLPVIEEKEYIMGFPVNYTVPCGPQGQRKSQDHLDTRHSLIGNSWSVPVVAWLIGQLCSPLGLCPPFPPQELVASLNPSRQVFLQSRLWRQPVTPLRGTAVGGPVKLVQQLGNLVSVKGEDLLLTTPSSQLTKFHRLRASVPGKLWHWKIIAGWKWRGNPEHINSLELRAVLTTLKWRIQHQRQVNCRFLHLVDSLVVLHSLSRGRSSSRKLRSSMSKINALLLCSSNQVLWGYIHTDQNPADKPSRWGGRVRTKFRNA